MPFPNNPLRYTIAYLLQSRAGLVLIDPGYGSDTNGVHLESELIRLGFRVEQIALILVTHYHLDHWGGADELAKLAGCEVLLSRNELSWFSGRSFNEFSPTEMKAWYSRLGVPNEKLELVASTDDVHQALMHKAPICPIEGGEVVPFTDGALCDSNTRSH